jgi:type II secretory pathway component PulJ
MQVTGKPDCGQSGFTFVEAMLALVILAGGLLALATGISQGMIIMAASHSHQIAKEKASEAMENVFTARDARKIAQWSMVQNVGRGGIFLDTPQPLGAPGPDGLINTADDQTTNVEVDRQAGPDNTLNTDDDKVVALDNYTRQIIIADVGSNLREIRVIISYTIGPLTRQYQLTAYISPYA